VALGRLRVPQSLLESGNGLHAAAPRTFVRENLVSGFPGSQPLSKLIQRAEGEAATYELPPDAPWRFMGVTPLVSWVRCDCLWWHRLPFVGRFVHSELP
jgi:hypothetical protein